VLGFNNCEPAEPIVDTHHLRAARDTQPSAMSRGGMDGGGNHPQPSDDLYNDAHRAFLQAFLSHSVFIIDDLKRIIADILTVQGKLSSEPPMLPY